LLPRPHPLRLLIQATQQNNGILIAQGSVNTSVLTANNWQPLALTSFTTPSWDDLTVFAYLGITKTGTPGGLYVLPTLLVT